MAQSPPLPLFTGEPSPPPRHLGLRRSRSGQLWIAVHLPDLALETVQSPCSHETAAGLEALAQWARRFTPSVSLEPPRAILAEVSGSLRLFGGLKIIEEALEREFQRRQLSATLCVAPTALAALWLARHRGASVRFAEELPGRLSGLPLHVTGWPDETRLLLRGLGVRTIGDCLRLPREGFVRRVGERYLRDLDRALGQHDPRPEYKPPQRLSSMLEFPDETTDPVILANTGEKLIENLAKALRKHQAQIQSLELGFYHPRGSVTAQHIILVDPTHEQERFSRLLRDKLERLSLPAPVIALGLRTGRLEPVVERNVTLFPHRIQAGLKAEIGILVERLCGRLGAGGIYGVALVAEHRPEAAWSRSMDTPSQRRPSSPPISPWAQHRPLWILPSPLRLQRTTAGLPHDRDQQPLRLDTGPERIESGWWDGEDIDRDYYVASSSKGEKLWVYWDRKNPDWYLHGVFG